MDDIALEAEFSKGLLYKYFQSKDDLFAAVGLRAHRHLLSLFEEAILTGNKGLHQISAIGKAYIRFAVDRPLYFEALVAHATGEVSVDPASFDAQAEHAADDILRLVQDVIRRGAADGSLRSDLEPVSSAFLLWGALHGLVVTATFKNVLHRHDLNPDIFLRDSLQFLAGCMKP
jgi:AcrR family transcriptional regulator